MHASAGLAGHQLLSSYDAVIVGSGPNGLGCAITLAQAGRSVCVVEAAPVVGGGMRSDTIGPGLVRDLCAAVMPFAVGSPFLQSLPLERHGLRWITPDVAFTHPLDNGRAGAAFHDIAYTAELLGADGPRYQTTIGPFADAWDALAADTLGPVAHLPKHPLTLARFGLKGLRSVTSLAGRFASDEAKGMLAGCAAHSVMPLTQPPTAAFALLFGASAHAKGWPVAAGGSQHLADALASYAAELGIDIALGHPIRTPADLPKHRVCIFDTDPHQVAAIMGHDLPDRYRTRLTKFAFGPGVFKVDYVLSQRVPWADSFSAATATVHVGGTIDEVVHAEAQVARGEHPDQPFVLVAQQSAIDPSRVADEKQVLWAYTHVPNGSQVDMTARIERQIERFAPDFRDTILERHASTTQDLETYNQNYVGGDIGGGAMNMRQLVARPRALRPYATPNPKVWLCSASTPPGGGVHAMAGYHAAKAVLRGRQLR